MSSRPFRPFGPPPGLRLAPVAFAAATLAVQAVHGQPQPQPQSPPGIELRSAPALTLPQRAGTNQGKLPVVVTARELRGRPDLETVASGDAELRRGDLLIRADTLTYQNADDLALARGNVRVRREGNLYTGTELQLRVERFEGYFLQPTYYFGRTGAGGQAQRIDFLDEQRAVATAATYTSCTPDGGGTPAWLLSTERVRFDFETNEGVAEHAVLRFYGVPILGAPSLSFPLTDERKSGWLPPSITIDSKSGLQFSMPYYWNIAPNRDATITPLLSAKRGAGAELEFRYLEPSFSGTSSLNLLPNDGLTGRSRYALNMAHDSALRGDTTLRLRLLRVSDNDYWKDFPRDLPSLTPRLLASDLAVNRPAGDWETYARIQRWQVLQQADARIEAPYERSPQIGARYAHGLGAGFDVGLETELNQFTNPADGVSAPRPTGLRMHVLGSVARPFASPGWTLTPKLSFNAASYSLDRPLADGRRQASRVIPTFSLDSAWVLERDTRWFGRALRQTLEPRLLYINTPYRAQDQLPNFDAAGKDFNFESIFTENQFSGVDRVSDAHQMTAGVTSRFLDPDTGAEALRLGVVQRYLFRDQRVTPDGVPFTQRFSDVLLLGSTSLVTHWNLDASVQYSPETKRTERSVIGARYSPGPYRTVSATYRLTRDLTEQVELGWQWPIYGRTPEQARENPARDRQSEGGASCGGSWYSVGRINYSTRDRRITDSVVGFEYDAGCWIGRIVAKRLSTGRSEATTGLSFQLELVGLSRLALGSNPLQVLKDNIPGYRLLRDDRAPIAPVNTYD